MSKATPKPSTRSAGTSKKSQGSDLRSFFGPSQSQGASSTPSAKPKEKTEEAVRDRNNQVQTSQASSSRKSIELASKSESTTPKLKDDEDESEDEPKPPKKKANDRATTSHTSKAASKKQAVVISSDSEVEETKPSRPSTSANRPARPKKRVQDSDSEYSDEETKPSKINSKSRAPNTKTLAASKTADVGKTSKTSSAKSTNTSTAADKESEGSKEQKPSKAANWAAVRAVKLAGPSAPGSKPIPDGEDNCLAGLAFVFTGELSSLSRDEATNLAKRFGGRVTLQPSSKTDFVIIGEGAGQSKLAAIKKNHLKTLDEDGFLDLIKTRKAPRERDLDEKTRKKLKQEREAMESAAREMEKREKKMEIENARKGDTKAVPVNSQLWTTRYAPQNLKEICGNKSQVEKLQQWLNDWNGSLKSSFKKPGKNGMNIFRAVLITGPPGIGKTTSAHLCASLAGLTPIELNASDARSKKLVENATNIQNTSLDGWMAGSQATNAAGMAITDKSCLIMDEVDGMSAGDRGGVGALNTLIKKTKIPIICIANDRNAPKLKPLLNTTYNLKFHKPEVTAIRSRIMTILFKEKMKIPANVIDQLLVGAQSDIRQILNMLSTWKLSSDTMDFDEGRALAKANEKYAMLSPFEITNRLLGPHMFSPNSKETLGEKMELYFHDPSFAPLFIQENYLKTQPSKTRNLSHPEQTLKHLRLMDEAASAISDGDLVDSLIHGPEQHWSLMPLHSVCSVIRPAACVYGAGAGYGGANGMGFPQFLGQLSKQNKLGRQLNEIQARMRLKISGNKAEIRQLYVPALYPRIVKPLIDDGADAVEDVIQCLDEYYLSKDDWDAVVELGVGDRKDEQVLKNIATATKTALTRKYNASDHPIAFHKAYDLGKVPKKLPSDAAPDLEEAFDVEEEIISDEELAADDNDNVVSDKLIKEKQQGKKSSKSSVAIKERSMKTGAATKTSRSAAAKKGKLL